MHPRLRFKLCYGIFRKKLKAGYEEPHIQRGLFFEKCLDNSILITWDMKNGK